MTKRGARSVEPDQAGLGTRVGLESAPAASVLAGGPDRCAVPGRDARDALEGEAPAARVLLVEDESMLVALGTRVLTRAGHEVVAVSTGPAALAALADSSAHVDVVVLDLTLPGGVTGPDLYAAARSARPGAAVVIASGWAASTIELPGIPADGYLQKPYVPANLVAAVAAALAGRRAPAFAP